MVIIKLKANLISTGTGIATWNRVWQYLSFSPDHRQSWTKLVLIQASPDHSQSWSRIVLITARPNRSQSWSQQVLSDENKSWSQLVLIPAMIKVTPDQSQSWSQLVPITTSSDHRSLSQTTTKCCSCSDQDYAQWLLGLEDFINPRENLKSWIEIWTRPDLKFCN